MLQNIESIKERITRLKSLLENKHEGLNYHQSYVKEISDILLQVKAPSEIFELVRFALFDLESVLVFIEKIESEKRLPSRTEIKTFFEKDLSAVEGKTNHFLKSCMAEVVGLDIKESFNGYLAVIVLKGIESRLPSYVENSITELNILKDFFKPLMVDKDPIALLKKELKEDEAKLIINYLQGWISNSISDIQADSNSEEKIEKND